MSPPHHPPSNDVTKATTRELFGMSLALEPEVLSGQLARIQAKSLARIITNLINENEPLLKADADGTVIAIDERGGTGGFVVTVTPAVAARSLDGELDAR
jgi:hypothetical protein